MTFLLAVFPVLVILFLMVAFRWGAARAGLVGYLCGVLIATFFFGCNLRLLAFAHMKALLLTMDVLFIVWSAFLLFRVADEAGAVQIIGKNLPKLTPDRGMQALLIGWGFASFLQGVGGFGVPVAVIAPLMIVMGFSPLSSVVIPSIGHSWAVTYGSLASSFQALMATTDLPGEYLAPYSALFLGIGGIAVGFLVAHAAGGFPAIRRLFVPVLILSLVMGTVQYVLATSNLWNIAAFGAGIAGVLCGVLLSKRPMGKGKVVHKPEMQNDRDRRSSILAYSGYGILIIMTVLIQLVPGIRTALSQAVINVHFPELQTSLGFTTPAGYGRKITVFSHAGAILTYSSILAYLVYRRTGMLGPDSMKKILSGTITGVASSSLGIISMVTMAVIMSHAGMTDTIARGLAVGVGTAFPFISPWIGALGAFMTGSNTNSNVVFSVLQMRTAELLHYNVAIILAAQTAGGAFGSVIAPTKIVVGASTAGMAGKEGEIIAKMGVYTLILVLLISLLTMIGVWVL